VVIIAMVGNAFSPRYHAERKSSISANPLDFSAMHVAVYGPDGGAFALTEHGARDVSRNPDRVLIGKSHVAWEKDGLGQDCLVARLDEVTSPFPKLVARPLRGEVRLWPKRTSHEAVALDSRGDHQWFCHAPDARVSVTLDEPNIDFQGSGYFDENAGAEGLEDAFASWQWSRANLASGRAFVHYATREHDERGGHRRASSRLFANGKPTPVVSPPEHDLGKTLFGLARRIRLDTGTAPTSIRTLEDGPHYARTLVRGRVLGEDAWIMHETFDGERFRAPWVRFLLPFRMRGGRAKLFP